MSKCGLASVQRGNNIFALTLGGYCMTGSNTLSDYQYYPSKLCRNGRGGFSQGWYILDVYQVTNQRSFSDSAVRVINGTATPSTSNLAGTPTSTPSSNNSTNAEAVKANSSQKFTFSFVTIILTMIVTWVL